MERDIDFNDREVYRSYLVRWMKKGMDDLMDEISRVGKLRYVDQISEYESYFRLLSSVRLKREREEGGSLMYHLNQVVTK